MEGKLENIIEYFTMNYMGLVLTEWSVVARSWQMQRKNNNK